MIVKLGFHIYYLLMRKMDILKIYGSVGRNK